MEMTREGALELLAAMCADGAECIETGAKQYLEGVKLERKGKKMLKNALKVIEQGREMKDSICISSSPKSSSLRARSLFILWSTVSTL